ncbi:MAG TPA: IclR family transcriptional regulator, partial [Clostridium sp.]|nr:IclR family transcriptional regulator [Clostridium sp.]
MNDKGKKIIQSVDKAFQILECFNNYEELGVTEISKMLDLHKSTTYGLISTLSANNILEKDDNTGKYRLGLKLYQLG